MIFKILLAVFLLAVFVSGKVIHAVDEEDIYLINDKYPSRYSVLIFVGQEVGLWSRVSGFFGETKQKQQERELKEIIDFFEKEPHYEIPVIEADIDKADFSNAMEEFGVESVPWIVILDENNDKVYSKEPIEEADEEILLVMNIFPSTIVSSPTDSDMIVIDYDDESEEADVANDRPLDSADIPNIEEAPLIEEYSKFNTTETKVSVQKNTTSPSEIVVPPQTRRSIPAQNSHNLHTASKQKVQSRRNPQLNTGITRISRNNLNTDPSFSNKNGFPKYSAPGPKIPNRRR